MNRFWCSRLKDIICYMQNTIRRAVVSNVKVILIRDCRCKQLLDFVYIYITCKYHKNSIINEGLLSLRGIFDCSFPEHVLFIIREDAIFLIVILEGMVTHSSVPRFRGSSFHCCIHDFHSSDCARKQIVTLPFYFQVHTMSF